MTATGTSSKMRSTLGGTTEGLDQWSHRRSVMLQMPSFIRRALSRPHTCAHLAYMRKAGQARLDSHAVIAPTLSVSIPRQLDGEITP